MTVKRIMNPNVVYLTPDDTVSHAARLLHRHKIGMLPICSKDGKLRGVVTDRDIAIRCVVFDNPPDETKLRDIMTRGIITISPDDDITEAANTMAIEQVRRLPVVEDSRIVGILSLADIATRNSYNTEFSSALAEICIPENKFKKF